MPRRLFNLFLIILTISLVSCKKKDKDNFWLPPGTGTDTGVTNPYITIVSTVIPGATTGEPFSFTFLATGDNPPFTWENSSGSLIWGLSLDNAGTLSGTCNFIREATFTITVTDSLGNLASREFYHDCVSQAPGLIEDRYYLGKPKIEGIDYATDDRYDWGPCIIRLDNGMYQMWWTRNDPLPNQDQISYAYSYDMVHWYGRQRVLYSEASWELPHCADPSVVLVNGTYYIMYEVGSAGSENPLGLATSADGITWTKYPRMIPGREADPLEPVLRVGDLTDPFGEGNGHYGLGFVNLIYKDNKFMLFYYNDCVDARGTGSPYYANMYAETTDIYDWGNTWFHTPVRWGPCGSYDYSPKMNKFITLKSVNDQILPEPPDYDNILRSLRMYMMASVDNDGLVWSTMEARWWDHDGYRVTLSSSPPRMRSYPGMVRNKHGWLRDIDTDMSTFIVCFCEGDIPQTGDFKQYHYTWDLVMWLVKYDLFSGDPLVLPSGLDFRRLGDLSLFRCERGLKYPHFSWTTYSKIKGTKTGDYLDIDPVVFDQIPDGGFWWVEDLNFQIDGAGTIYYIKDFTKYTYSDQTHFLSYGYSLDDIISMTAGEFASATGGMPEGGLRP